MRRAIILFIALSTFYSCSNFKDFTLYKSAELGNGQLRKGGVFYYEHSVPYPKPQDSDKALQCFILFEDGTYMNLYSVQLDNGIDSTISKTLTNFKLNKERFSKSVKFWGAYKIANDTLYIQNFLGGYIPYRVYNKRGLILNDSTVKFIRNEYSKEKDKWIPSEVIYQFYSTNNKPDSTNLFTTNKKINKKLNRLIKKRAS